MHDFLSECGEVLFCSIIKDKRGVNVGRARIVFESASEATKAFEFCGNNMYDEKYPLNASYSFMQRSEKQLLAQAYPGEFSCLLSLLSLFVVII